MKRSIHPSHDNDQFHFLRWAETSVEMLAESFLDGVRHGWQSKFYANGAVACAGAFVSGEHHGWWAFFAPSGRLESSVEFKRGKPVLIVPPRSSIEHALQHEEAPCAASSDS